MENQATMTPPTAELSQKENQVKVKTMAEMEMQTLLSVNATNIKIELRLLGESIGQYNCYTFQEENIGNLVEQILQLIQEASLEVYEETGKVPFDYHIENVF